MNNPLDKEFKKKIKLLEEEILSCQRVIVELNEAHELSSIELTRQKEDKYKVLFESANDAIFTLMEDKFIDCNDKTLEIFDCTREQIIERTPVDFSPDYQPDGERSIDKALHYISDALSGEPQFFEWMHTKYDGTPFYAEVSLNKFEFESEVYIHATVRDISKRKDNERKILVQNEKLIEYKTELEKKVEERTEQIIKTNEDLKSEIAIREETESELRQTIDELTTIQDLLKKNQHELQTFVNTIDSFVGRVEFSVDERIIYANRNFLVLTTESFDEIIGRKQIEFISEERLTQIDYKLFWDNLKKGIVQKGVHQYVFDGNEVWLYSTFNPVMDFSGQVKSVIALFYDISLVKEHEHLLREQAALLSKNLYKLTVAQTDLKESKRRFEELANLLPQAVFETDKLGNFTFINKSGMNILGVLSRDFKKGCSAIDTVASEDRWRIIGNIRRILSGEISTGNEYSIVNKEGSRLPVLMYSSRVLREKKVIGLRGVAIDISALKHAEKKIKAQLKKITKQNSEIEKQRDDLINQNDNIVESLTYAKRIQTALLPTELNLDRLLKDYFIFYRSKEIVSGDFYWVSKRNDKIILVAADCTGHGVPGAFMSILSISLLNEIVEEIETLDPGEILKKLRESVIETLKQSNKEVGAKDGLDIALCIIDKENGEVHFAGANNPMFLLRDNELTEIKSDRMPISIYYDLSDFSNHSIKLQKGDAIYIFTDGYADQFGGVENRKFKKWRFKKLLESISDLPMDKQKKIIIKTFDDWKGENDQVDDVLVIGVRC